MSENDDSHKGKYMYREREQELLNLITAQPIDQMQMLRNAQPHQIQYYLDVREDIESKYRFQNGNEQDENKILISQYLTNGNNIQDDSNEYEEDDFNSEIDENQININDDENLQKYVKEMKKEIIKQTEKTILFRIIYSNGDIYEGEIDNDLKEGSGVYFFSNGEKYEGLFQDDMIHGYGVYYFHCGHKYEGDWIEGEKSGIGILEFSSGDKYKGEFQKDSFQGKGAYHYKNGDRFEGEWKNGKKNGYGKFYGKDGRRIFGEWIEDELQHF